ncbi:MAG: hypothetical protein ACRDSZ_04245 [Pseudonocardiaceae bacterium]
MECDAVEPAQGQPGAAAVQVAGVDEVAGGEVVQAGEDGGLAAGEVFGFAYALCIGVTGGEFECHIAGGELEPVDAGSAPVGDELNAAAYFPEAAPHVFGEADHVWGLEIHSVSVAVTVWLVVGGSGPAPTRWYRSGARSARRLRWVPAKSGM